MKRVLLASAIASLFVGAVSAQSAPPVASSYVARTAGSFAGVSVTGNGTGNAGTTVTNAQGQAITVQTHGFRGVGAVNADVSSAIKIEGTAAYYTLRNTVTDTIVAGGVNTERANGWTAANPVFTGGATSSSIPSTSCFDSSSWALTCSLTFTASTLRLTGINEMVFAVSGAAAANAQYIGVLTQNTADAVHAYNAMKYNHTHGGTASASSPERAVESHFSALGEEIAATRPIIASARGLVAGHSVDNRTLPSFVFDDSGARLSFNVGNVILGTSTTLGYGSAIVINSYTHDAANGRITVTTDTITAPTSTLAPVGP